MNENVPVSPNSRPSPGQGQMEPPGLAGLVAIAATFLSIPGILGVLAVFIYVWFVQPDLKVDSMLLLLLGAAILSVAFFSVTGLFAGILESFQSHRNKGISSLAIVVNSVVLLAIGGLLLIGALAG